MNFISLVFLNDYPYFWKERGKRKEERVLHFRQKTKTKTILALYIAYIFITLDVFNLHFSSWSFCSCIFTLFGMDLHLLKMLLKSQPIISALIHPSSLSFVLEGMQNICTAKCRFAQP